MSLIEVNNLSKTFVTYKRGGSFSEAVKSLLHREKVTVKAVDDVSFTVEKGEIVGILGPNGAGKSTTIKMLTGTLFPTSGNINVKGFVPHKDRVKYVANIGAVFGQRSQLIWDIPPIDSFNLNKAIYDIDDGLFKSNLKTLTELFMVEDIMEKPTRVLSLGERMKCEFIMSMLHSPDIVFLDEPTIGLDVIAKERIHAFIKAMNNRGVTFILTTHDLEDVEQLAQRAIIINHGQKVTDSSLPELKLKLGAKKVVRIAMKTKLPEFCIDDIGIGIDIGISITNKINDYEAELEVDTNKIPIGDFIGSIIRQGEITDISVTEISIERIIKEIYNK